jgi:C_GCAxxG_C_C family probable redox protein
MSDKNGSMRQLIDGGLAERERLNCSETMLYAADRVYDLRLPQAALKLSAGFGGGMGVEKSCGAVTGAVMAVSTLFVKNRAKEDEQFKVINQAIFQQVEEELGSTDCAALKAKYRDEVDGCKELIGMIGTIVEGIIDRELALRDMSPAGSLLNGESL